MTDTEFHAMLATRRYRTKVAFSTNNHKNAEEGYYVKSDDGTQEFFFYWSGKEWVVGQSLHHITKVGKD